MNTKDLIDEFVPYSGPGRKVRIGIPSYIIIHATRGNARPEAQYQATINWVTMKSVKRRLAGWNSMTDFVVGAQGKIAAIGDWQTTRSNWSAGKGTLAWWRQYGADEHGIAIELAQTDKLEPMTEECLDSAADLCFALCTEFSIPVVHLPFITQLKNQSIPGGLVGHDETANGRKWGKSDPGWSDAEWNSFLLRVTAIQTLPWEVHHHKVVLTDGFETTTSENF